MQDLVGCLDVSYDTINRGGGGGIQYNKMKSYQDRNSRCGDEMILWPSYLHSGISYTGQTTWWKYHSLMAKETLKKIMLCVVSTVPAGAPFTDMD